MTRLAEWSGGRALRRALSQEGDVAAGINVCGNSSAKKKSEAAPQAHRPAPRAPRSGAQAWPSPARGT